MSRAISNSDDIIDSRDVIKRIEELEEQRLPFAAGWNLPGCLPDSEPELFEDFEHARQFIIDELKAREGMADDEDTASEFCHAAEDVNLKSDEFEVMVDGIVFFVMPAHNDGLDDDDAAELKALQALAEEAEGYSEDWLHGAALIRDSYFEDYARDLAEDIGAIDRNASWPNTCIDWEQAARELQMDYTSVEFDGVVYWIR